MKLYASSVEYSRNFRDKNICHVFSAGKQSETYLSP